MTDIMSTLKLHSTPNVQIPDSTEVKFMRAAINEARVALEAKDAEIRELRAALLSTKCVLMMGTSPYLSGCEYDLQWDKQKDAAIAEADALLAVEQRVTTDKK